MAIKTISFDFWGTLADSNPNYVTQRNLFLSKISNKNLDFITTYLKDLKKDYDSIIENTGVSFDTHNIYKKICINLDIGVYKAHEIQTAFHEIFIDNLPILKQDTIKVLNDLKENKYELILSSNTLFINSEIMIMALKILNIYHLFDSLIYSDQISVSKPHYKFYKHVLEESKNFSSEIIHIGDNISTDLTGAKNFGFKTYYISDIYKTTLTTFYNDLKNLQND